MLLIPAHGRINKLLYLAKVEIGKLGLLNSTASCCAGELVVAFEHSRLSLRSDSTKGGA